MNFTRCMVRAIVFCVVFLLLSFLAKSRPDFFTGCVAFAVTMSWIVDGMWTK